MTKIPVIAIFDIGKTNKKIFLLDEYYAVQWQQTVQLNEITDEDGFACEDIIALTNWIKNIFNLILSKEEFNLKAVNFSAYGASLVHLNKAGIPFLPLCNYLKPYPIFLLNNFYKTYGNPNDFAVETAARVTGNLNAGLQLYRLKHQHQNSFNLIDVSLHLPQYLSYILTGKQYSEITSIGCHTCLWNFNTNAYHYWVNAEQITPLLAPVYQGNNCNTISVQEKQVAVGIGLHDSSAALIPYLLNYNTPFVLISTGTWCVSLNPFNETKLTAIELENDCCCYLSFNGKPIKAAKIFAGNEHETQIKKLAAYFNKPINYYTMVEYDPAIVLSLNAGSLNDTGQVAEPGNTSIINSTIDISLYKDYETAYHHLMMGIVQQQQLSTNLILKNSPVNKIFVDGGFSKNKVYLFLLAQQFSGMEVYAATLSQASAIGAALAIHEYWNDKKLPENLIGLKLYTPYIQNNF